MPVVASPSSLPPASSAPVPASEAPIAPIEAPRIDSHANTRIATVDHDNARLTGLHPRKTMERRPALADVEVSLPVFERGSLQSSFLTELARLEKSDAAEPRSTLVNTASRTSIQPNLQVSSSGPIMSGASWLVLAMFALLAVIVRSTWRRHTARRANNTEAVPVLLHAIDELAGSLRSHGRDTAAAHLAPIQHRLQRQLRSKLGTSTMGHRRARWLLLDELERTAAAIERRGDTRNARLARALIARQKEAALA